MAVEHQLRGRRIAVLAADGFEKVELTVPVTALRAAGADVDIISLRPGRIRGVNLHEPASRVKVDHTLSDVSVDDYSYCVINEAAYCMNRRAGTAQSQSAGSC